MQDLGEAQGGMVSMQDLSEALRAAGKGTGVEVQVLVGAALPAAPAPFQRQLGQAEQTGPYAGQR